MKLRIKKQSLNGKNNLGGYLRHRDEDLNTLSICVRVQSFIMLLGVTYHRNLSEQAVDIRQPTYTLQ